MLANMRKAVVQGGLTELARNGIVICRAAVLYWYVMGPCCSGPQTCENMDLSPFTRIFLCYGIGRPTALDPKPLGYDQHFGQPTKNFARPLFTSSLSALPRRWAFCSCHIAASSTSSSACQLRASACRVRSSIVSRLSPHHPISAFAHLATRQLQ